MLTTGIVRSSAFEEIYIVNKYNVIGSVNDNNNNKTASECNMMEPYRDKFQIEQHPVRFISAYTVAI
jgi:hypothetical protein